MAYVVWRVFMKKYARIRLGVNRNPPQRSVNPVERPILALEYKPEVKPTSDDAPDSTSGVARHHDAFDDDPQEMSTNQSIRKSSKVKRVKTYLKKCKDAALGTNNHPRVVDETQNEPEKQTDNKTGTSKKCPTLSKEALPNTCWYVAENFETTNLDNQIEVVEVLPLEDVKDLVRKQDKEDLESDNVTFETCKVRKESSDQDSERGLAEMALPEVDELSTSPAEVEGVVVNCHNDGDDSKDVTAIKENKCDVASLVDIYLGHLYSNFEKTRCVLIRQARDLLVCTYHGNLAAFKRDFLTPAASLLETIRDATLKDSSDVLAPRGWPLSLGSRGVSIQLGELDPTLLRHRDCYLCVRLTSPPVAVELALVWRNGSRPLHIDALETPVTLDMAAAAAVNASNEDVNNLAVLLQSLLVSVERAIERVSLDDLAFPCPQCHAYMLATDYDEDVDEEVENNKCGCQCLCKQPPVLKKEMSIQTNPLFEFVGSIPHIDSDEDEDDYQDNYRKLSQDSGIQTSSATTMSTAEEEVEPPRSIADLPDKWLLSGIHLPGTHDLHGRPLILYDTLNVSRASLDHQQIATTILYYSTLTSYEKMSKGLTVIVVVSGSGEESSLNHLDKAFSLITKHVKIGNVLIWRQDRIQVQRRHRKSLDLFERSQIKYRVVTDEASLRNFLPEEQIPVTCGGQSSHDQLEWVEFHKELEPFLAQCHSCGHRLVAAMSELRTTEPHGCALTRRQLHHQHRTLSRALNDGDLQRLRREGAATIGRLEERAQWLPASEHVRSGMERARRLHAEVDRASRRLEELADGRRERLRDLARVRALEDESEQVLAWLCKKGEDTLKKHAQLATSLQSIKQQENDFEKFYFISMRHLDKGSDLLEAASQCTNETRSDGSRGSLKDLARSLKQHLMGFGERLEDTRERLEDTSRCFYLLDKAYEWGLEAMKYMSRLAVVDEVQTSEQAVQILKLIQQYLMAHPTLSEEHFAEMLTLSAKLGNDKLQQQAKVANSRCQETMETIRTHQARLSQMRKVFGGEEEGCQRSVSPKGWKPATSTPVPEVGRRRSVGSVPFLYKCNHHAAGHSCTCWDPSPLPEDCCCAANSLGNIQEVRESAEDLLDTCDRDKDKTETRCNRCDDDRMNALKRQLRRSCTWQYPTESFDEDASQSGSAGHLSADHSGDNTTEGSDGCAKSGENGDDLDDQEVGNKCVPPVSVNSHLHCNASNLDLSNSLAEPGSKEQKTHKTLLYIMREMIQTERDYVNSLEYIIENYIPELLREDIPQALRGQRNVIFGNVEKIYEFHSQYFLRELEKCENSPLLIGQSFLRHEKKFYLYALYNKNKPKSDGIMSEYGTAFFKAKQLELGDKMDLASYLLKPVQRMGKYALLLQQLIKASADKSTDLDVTDMKAADKMVRFQLRHGNDLLAMDSLRDCDINVKEQGRLLRQSEFLVWQGKGKKCLRHVFLFEDLILFSKARRFPDRKNLDLYIYKNSIKLTDIGLTAKIGDSPTKFEIWFRKRKPNDTFTLQSMSEDVKQAWAEELSKLLWKQAMRNRESRLAEMSSMGIGNKPCLDIRPSADQINDRSISIAQLSKTAPRFRNSITVSSGELSRCTKRPHSIISVSSSSSSGGSTTSHSSSAYGGGPLINLGFDPADSPRLHHRSATLNSQCSMESGIIADISLGSEDTDSSGNHWCVERSNSSATNVSADSAVVSPTSPISPVDECKTMHTNSLVEQVEFYNIKL